jgi:hypothetical protein
MPDGQRTMTDFAVAKYVFLATYGLWFALALGYLLMMDATYRIIRVVDEQI